MTDNHASIMVVDDEQGLVTTLAGILEDEGYDVIGVNDGNQAIALAKESPFALIFMDVKMPGINGVEAFREIKKTSPDSVVVMMTGFSVEELVKDALEEGAYAVIHKPFEVGQILDIVQSVLKTTFVLVVDDRAVDRETLGAVLEDSAEGLRGGRRKTGNRYGCISTLSRHLDGHTDARYGRDHHFRGDQEN